MPAKDLGSWTNLLLYYAQNDSTFHRFPFNNAAVKTEGAFGPQKRYLPILTNARSITHTGFFHDEALVAVVIAVHALDGACIPEEAVQSVGTGAGWERADRVKALISRQNIRPCTQVNDRASEADDFPDSGVQVKDMAISVFELIDGHKGHTGTCLAFMDQQKAYTLAQWNGLVANTMLVTHLFYRQVVEAVREESGDDADIRQWGAHRGGRASSLLCPMFILGRPAISNFSLDKDVDPSSRLLETEEDRLWVLETAIELLDGNLLKSPEAWLDNDTPLEYRYQLAFMTRLKVARVDEVFCELIRSSSAGALARPRDLQWNLGRWADSSLRKHYVKAPCYAQQHSALVYLVNITMDADLVLESSELTTGMDVTHIKVIYSDSRVHNKTLNLKYIQK
ncbi:hypothetical protein SELMODRAFT_428541 [Selaginella moellendorffii]|uniref:Uncharacterized protein n=1 Tax=Selaginella moellendorffii TaxID=88036 RepID=D8T366_SELML|nr:hypothetical protein SELMODRAFT_428541 [Selaginella moellendorffii]